MKMFRRMALLTVSAGRALAPRWPSGPHCDNCRQHDQSVILYYHGVTGEQAAAFRRQMEWLATQAKPLALADCVQPALATSDAISPMRPRVCVTFDDAFANLLDHALPVLHELRIPATIFAVSGNLGTKPRWELPEGHWDAHQRTMTADEIGQLPAKLIEVGSHTHTHARLSRLSFRQAELEFRRSKCELEQITGREVVSLSVPFGDHPAYASALAADCGYKRLVTCDRHVVNADSDPLHMGRFKVTPDDWPLEFRLKAAGAYNWLGRLRDNEPEPSACRSPRSPIPVR